MWFDFLWCVLSEIVFWEGMSFMYEIIVGGIEMFSDFFWGGNWGD